MVKHFRKNRGIAILLTAVLIINAFVVTTPNTYAGGLIIVDDDPTITVGTASGRQGETVDIPVSIENNSGIVSLNVNIGYDSTRLKLVGVTNGTVLTDPAHSGSFAVNPYRLCFDMSLSPTNNTANGVIATLQFEILQGAALGDTAIIVNYDQNEIYNVSYDNVYFDKNNGKITVLEPFPASLTGTATIGNTNPRIGDVLTASLVGGNNTGTLTYTWKSGAETLGTGINYTVLVGDLGKQITLEITSNIETGTLTSTATAAVLKKIAPSAPSVPTLQSKTHNSVTLTPNVAYEFSMNGTAWQTSNVFSGLSPNTAYTFYQRVAETADTLPSISSPVFNVSTDAAPPNALTGTATIGNTNPRIGDVLTASLVGGNNTGTLTYTWKSGAETLGTGINYTVLVGDLGKQITLEITSNIETGTLTSTATAAVLKKTAPSAPSVPTLASKTHNSITLTANVAYEFSMNGTTWQTSNMFSGLSPSTAYTFYQRIAETADTLPSATSPVLNETTNPAPLTPAITIGAVSGKQGETVDVFVSISNNSGIVSFNVNIAYDSTKLRLAGVTNGTVLSGPAHSGSLNTNPYRLSFDMSLDPENNTSNGVIATLQFEILTAAAPGDTAITAEYNPNEVYDIHLNNVFFEKINGKVTIQESEETEFYMSFLDEEVKIWAEEGIIPKGSTFEVIKIVPPPPEVVDKAKDQISRFAEVLAYYEIRLFDANNNPITQLSGEITVATKLPAGYEDGKGVGVYQEDETGKLIRMVSWVEGGYIFYTTNWLEIYE